MNNTQRPVHAFSRIPDRETARARIDLNGSWEFKAADERDWLQAAVPGTVHAHLIKAGRLEDPFYRDNEFKCQWVEKKDWEYRRTFQADESFVKHQRILLHCHGLDTIAEVYLNGRLVANTENMFIAWEFDIKPFLKAGENNIHIIFRSILAWNAEKAAADSRYIWEDEKGNSFFARKCGADFGWDWGIRLLTCGIWRPILIAAYDDGRITELHVRQNITDGDKAVLHVNAHIENLSQKKLDLQIKVQLGDSMIFQKVLPACSGELYTEITLNNPRLWWPNGWGEQPLYTVAACLTAEETCVHERKIRIGLRSIALVQEKDERGLTFAFKVNGHPIFCKGANWIPAGIMRDLLTEEHYLHLLNSCKETHFNMIRLWGGGIYEAECFYDFCDENGIMLWHDFAFAVGPYLEDRGFLENVGKEIANVVRRLRHHPSIVLWCGNNEQESAMPKWQASYSTVTWEGYDACFNRVIPEMLRRYDPDRPYWPCSPHHPLDRTRRTPGYRTASGDAHVWEVWHQEEYFSWYEKNPDFRFVSEYGLQSLPAMETVLAFTAREDRSLSSRILDLRNKGGKRPLDNEDIGNAKLLKYISLYFKVPQCFEDFVYTTQILQGEAMKVGTEAFRRNYPATTGALYWQINDDWPTVSWSSMDYFGRWKAVQYMAAHYFNPILASGKVDGEKVKLWGVNDYLHAVPVKLQWTLAGFDGSVSRNGEKELILPANRSTVLAEMDFQEDIGENPEHSTYRDTNYERKAKYYLAYRLVQDGRVLSSNVAFFAPQKYLELARPEITASIKTEGKQVSILLEANRFAAYVELGFGDQYARFTDNYFHLLPGETKKVGLPDHDTAIEDISARLRVKSLVDI